MNEVHHRSLFFLEIVLPPVLYHLTGAPGVKIGQNLGCTTGDKNHPPTERLHFTRRQLQLLTGIYSP